MPTRRQLDPQVMTVFFPEDGRPHGAINKHGNLSRWFIGDTEYDDLQNFIPLGPELQQTPPLSAVITTLAASAIWISAQPLNQATYLFCLCTNGHIYQVSLGGVITDVTGATAMGAASDIANWQGTTILFSDVAASKIYSWNGTTFATVFSAQPAAFITVYSNRLWMANQSTITVTQGGTFNSLTGDAFSFVITSTDTPPPIRLISPYGGNLYVGGYNWFQVYGGLFDSGSPPVTQFQTSTLTDEAGLINKWSFIPFGYSVLYSSLQAIWNLLGSQPIKMSYNIDGFYQSLNVANSSFSAAFGWVLGEPCCMWNFFYSPDSTYRIACLKYNPSVQAPQEWFTINTGNINFITYGVDQTNGQQKVWGVDTSNKLYQIMGGTGNVTSKVNTKLWSFGNRIREKSIGKIGAEMVVTGPTTVSLIARDKNLNSYTPDLQSTNPTTAFLWTNNGRTFNWTNSGAFAWTVPATQYELMEFDVPITSKKVGVDMTVVGTGAVIGAFAVEFVEQPADWGQ